MLLPCPTIRTSHSCRKLWHKHFVAVLPCGHYAGGEYQAATPLIRDLPAVLFCFQCGDWLRREPTVYVAGVFYDC